MTDPSSASTEGSVPKSGYIPMFGDGEGVGFGFGEPPEVVDLTKTTGGTGAKEQSPVRKMSEEAVKTENCVSAFFRRLMPSKKLTRVSHPQPTRGNERTGPKAWISRMLASTSKNKGPEVKTEVKLINDITSQITKAARNDRVGQQQVIEFESRVGPALKKYTSQKDLSDSAAVSKSIHSYRDSVTRLVEEKEAKVVRATTLLAKCEGEQTKKLEKFARANAKLASVNPDGAHQKTVAFQNELEAEKRVLLNRVNIAVEEQRDAEAQKDYSEKFIEPQLKEIEAIIKAQKRPVGMLDFDVAMADPVSREYVITISRKSFQTDTLYATFLMGIYNKLMNKESLTDDEIAIAKEFLNEISENNAAGSVKASAIFLLNNISNINKPTAVEGLQRSMTSFIFGAFIADGAPFPVNLDSASVGENNWGTTKVRNAFSAQPPNVNDQRTAISSVRFELVGLIGVNVMERLRADPVFNDMPYDQRRRLHEIYDGQGK